jgi:hypothetical protein
MMDDVIQKSYQQKLDLTKSNGEQRVQEGEKIKQTILNFFIKEDMLKEFCTNNRDAVLYTDSPAVVTLAEELIRRKFIYKQKDRRKLDTAISLIMEKAAKENIEIQVAIQNNVNEQSDEEDSDDEEGKEESDADEEKTVNYGDTYSQSSKFSDRNLER